MDQACSPWVVPGLSGVVLEMLDSLKSPIQEVQDPVAEGSVQERQFFYQKLRNDSRLAIAELKSMRNILK